MQFPLFPRVSAEPSRSSYGRWVVKYSEVSFRFFWRKSEAEDWAARYNAGQITDLR